MKKLLCPECQEVMNSIKQYRAIDKIDKKKEERKTEKVKDGIVDLSISKFNFMVEEHQCENRDCKRFADVRYYQISGNRAIELKKDSFDIINY